MVYDVPFLYLFICWLVIITCSAWFVIGSWNSIIIEFIAIYQNSIYILLSCCMNKSLAESDLSATSLFLSFYSVHLNTYILLTSLATLTHFIMQCNPWSTNSLCFMKIQSYSLLVTFITSLLVIITPISASCLSLLRYLSEINLARWK